MRVKLDGYASQVNDTHFIMWISNHEQIKAIIANYGPVQFTPLREFQKIKVWGGKLYPQIVKSGATPNEVFTELGSFSVSCEIKKTPKAINISAQEFVFN